MKKTVRAREIENESGRQKRVREKIKNERVRKQKQQ